MDYPETRLRRLRQSSRLRDMVRETRLHRDRLILPLFVCSGDGVKREISSMPGHYQASVEVNVELAKEARDLGIPAVLLFGIPDHKDAVGSSGYAADGVVQRLVTALKREVPDLYVITDVCNCEYTSHGHCGILNDKGEVENDSTLELLVRQALSHARAGADMVAPSDMMDGRVGAIRRALDEKDFKGVPIMSYSAKYASAFYGPFREAAESAPEKGDRRGYQMDPANSDEALREVELDIRESADIVMVKPALSYLDIIHRVKSEFKLPVAAYNVSGEFAMVKAAGEKGWIDPDRVMMEVLTSIHRAGADMIITYHAKDAAALID